MKIVTVYSLNSPLLTLKKHITKVVCFCRPLKNFEASLTNIVDLDQTAPVGAVWCRSTLFVSLLMFSFILFRRNINYFLPRLLNIWKPDILPRIINCYDVHAYMPQHRYSASYMYIITVYISLYNILKDKISNITI